MHRIDLPNFVQLMRSGAVAFAKADHNAEADALRAKQRDAMRRWRTEVNPARARELNKRHQQAWRDRKRKGLNGNQNPFKVAA